MFRVDGALVPLKNGERLAPEELQKIAFSIMNPIQKTRFDETREVDLAYGIAGLGRFRVNVFQQRGIGRHRLPGDPLRCQDDRTAASCRR